jgi:hypothetical protein
LEVQKELELELVKESAKLIDPDSCLEWDHTSEKSVKGRILNLLDLA